MVVGNIIRRTYGGGIKNRLKWLPVAARHIFIRTHTHTNTDA